MQVCGNSSPRLEAGGLLATYVELLGNNIFYGAAYHKQLYSALFQGREETDSLAPLDIFITICYILL